MTNSNYDLVKQTFNFPQEGIELGLKVLADLALNNPETFKSLVDLVK